MLYCTGNVNLGRNLASFEEKIGNNYTSYIVSFFFVLCEELLMLSTFLGNFYLFKTSFSNVVCYNQSADVAVMFESMDEVGISFAILKG